MDVKASEAELRELMVAGLEGDARAYQALLDKLSSRLRGYFKGHLTRIDRGPVEAEDLVQEVLIAVHVHRDTYDRSQPFTPWAYAIARYKFVDYLRRTKESRKEAPLDDAEEVIAADDGTAVDSGIDLEALMAKLSPKAREVIRYVKIEGLSVREAAERCSMSESAIKVTVHRGLKALARLMERP